MADANGPNAAVTGVQGAAAAVRPAGPSTRPSALRRIFRTPKGVVGGVLVALVVLTGIFGPILIPKDAATHIDVLHRLAPPSVHHLLGTDQLGRDELVRMLLGARTSLYVGVFAVGLSILIGLPLGVVGGYFGGWVDLVLMRIVDAIISFPVLLLALTISAVLGPNLTNATLSIGIVYAPYLARIARSEVLKVAALPYVEAARASGAGHLWIMLRTVLPNIMPPVIVQATISMAFAILAEAALSFLGLGTQPPTPSWGLMIQAARDYLDMAPWTALVPGTAIALSVLGLNMLGDSLRDALDPSFVMDEGS
ncbi:MAG: ABC transporter permease [Deinococcales bacterium]|jgi:ABC-type dipeptide/oligopeptide/nickel transport system permease subunit